MSSKKTTSREQQNNNKKEPVNTTGSDQKTNNNQANTNTGGAQQRTNYPSQEGIWEMRIDSRDRAYYPRRHYICFECGKNLQVEEAYFHYNGMGPICMPCIEEDEEYSGHKWESA